MNRIVNIELWGNTYPMCLTLRAYLDICERFGDMKSCMMELDDVAGVFEKDLESGEVKIIVPENTSALIEVYTWLLGRLLWAGYKAADGEGPEPPLDSMLVEGLYPPDIPYIQRKVLETITLGQSRTVGAEAPKNEKGPAEG